ncbi:MAG: hypothetical protein KF861_08660 [Planctomycetaceae bacterium]|nr:hypothetical protein [Planctomycetaceae bacterium]
MRVSNVHSLMGLWLLLGLSGCYGYCGHPHGGYGPGCDGYGAYGPGGYDPYGDCVDGGGYYDDYDGYAPYGPDRLTLRERLQGRRDARLARRDARRGGPGRRHGGPRGGGYDDCCYSDCCFPAMDCCGGCCDMGGSDCCMPCGADSGSYMDGAASMEGGSFCQSCQAGMMNSPQQTCAGGNCPLGPNWQDPMGMSIPYSHEGQPTDVSPHPYDRGMREPYPAPPSSHQDPPEGQFAPAEDDSSVIRGGPHTSAPLRHTRWVPPQF